MLYVDAIEKAQQTLRNIRRLRKRLAAAVAAGQSDVYSEFLTSVEKSLTGIISTIRSTRKFSAKQEKAILAWSRGVDNAAKKLGVLK